MGQELQGPTPATARLDAAFDEAMNEDLNTAVALQVLLAELRAARQMPQPAQHEVAARARHLGQILGLFLPEHTRASVVAECLRFQSGYLGRPGLTTADVDRLLAERASTRKSKDFARSDAIRDELLLAGVRLLDSATGTSGWQFAVMPI
jgi:cysteinyl-tRNA synthetase